MKKLVLLLSALLILSTFTSSPSLASPPSFELRIQSLLSLFCRNVYPFSGVTIEQGDIDVITGGNGWGPRTGGDADDLANGKGNVPGESRPKANGCASGLIPPVWSSAQNDSK